MQVAGIWKCKITTPMAAQDATLAFSENEGKLSGQITTLLGTEDFEACANAARVQFTVNFKQPMPIIMDFDLSVDGNTIAGTVGLGDFGGAPLIGERVEG